MRNTGSLNAGILDAWKGVAQHIAGHAADFTGRLKEALVFDRLREEIERAGFAVTGSQVPFRIGEATWKIDLVCKDAFGATAVEGKFKLASDGAIPGIRAQMGQTLYLVADSYILTKYAI